MPGGGGIFANTFSVIYDPTFQGRYFAITARHYFDNTNQTVSLGADTIHSVGTYNLQQRSRYGIFYVDGRTSCNFYTLYDPPISGTLTITRFDTIAGVISGTFGFKVAKVNCGTIDGTDGRFDVRY